MSEYEKIEKKQKRSTINDALIAANLGEYTVAANNQLSQPQNLHNDPNIFQNELKVQPYFNPSHNYQVPNNYLQYNSLNSNINAQNNPITPNPLYNFFQKVNEKPPIQSYPSNAENDKIKDEIPNIDQNLINEHNSNKKKTRWGPTQNIVNPAGPGTKINNLTLNINNNTNININNPFNNPNNANFNNPQMKQFPNFPNPGLLGLNPNLTGLNPNLNPKNIMSFPIFNPMLSQNKPKPHNNFLFNPLSKMSTYQRFKMPDNNGQNLMNMNNGNNEDRIKHILENDEAPENLKDYLNRAYQKCNNPAEKNQMDKFLKKIINIAKIQNEINVRDWRNHPLPSLPRERSEINKDNTYSMNLELNEGLDHNEAISKIISMNNYRNYKNYKAILTKDNHFMTKNKLQVLSRINKPINNIGLKLTKNMKIIKQIKKNANMSINQQQQNNNEISQEEEDKRLQRRARFHKELSAPMLAIKKTATNQPHSTNPEEEEFDFEILCDKWKIKGACTDLEKSYLRLTSEPDPSQVRPEKVLKNSLKMLLNKWKEGSAKYNYISEQFRSIRQDLIIQHIRNDFTVKVYENNARICLECHDINQFNQCQGKLYELYKDGIKGNKYEFLCYRMIYLIMNNQKYEINRLLNELTEEDLKQKNIILALEFQNSMEMGNVTKVFNFYKSAPNLGQYLIDLFINKMRIWGLQIISKGFGEKIDIAYLTNLLAFNDPVHCINFLEETQSTLSEDKTSLLLRESHKVFLEHPIMQEKSYKAKK